MSTSLSHGLQWAVQQLQAQRPADALATLDRLVEADPGDALVHNVRGICLNQLERFEDAAASFERAARLRPNFPEAVNNLGVAQRKAGRARQAIESFREAIRLKPVYAEAFNNLGNALAETREPAQAEAAYLRALAINPAYADALNNLSAAYEAQAMTQDAVGALERLVALAPNAPGPNYNMGRLLAQTGRAVEALPFLDAAIRVNPNLAEAHFVRGVALGELMRLDDSLADLRRSLALRPAFAEAHFSLALLLLKLGRWREALGEYEWRKKLPEPFGLDKSRIPAWTGREDISKAAVLVYREQGLGDTVMFSRYLKSLSLMCRKVYLAVPSVLKELLSGLEAQVTFIAEGEAPDDVDYACAMMSLPWTLGAAPPNVQESSPYLSPAPDRLRHWRDRFAPTTAPRVAICWASRSLSPSHAQRSCGLIEFVQLVRPDIGWVSLQKPITPAEAEMLSTAGVWEIGSDLTDFADTAAALGCVDAVVTVDTALAHVAGALGVRTFLLLPFSADWRWFLDGATTPWYPMTTLLRQTSRGSWAEPLHRVAKALAAL